MISIIIPVYNAEKVIERCVESVFSQEYNDWELILIDDGSSDNSGDICDKYAKDDKRLVVIHQENQGPSIARNVGIQVAKGEYLCFIDSDDYVSPKYLIDFHIEKIPDLSIQGMKLVYINGRETETYKPKAYKFCLLKDALKESSIYPLLYSPCCKVFKTSIIKNNNIKFPCNVYYGEDRIFVLRYLQYCKNNLLLSPKANYIYTHENNNSLTSKRKKSVDLLQSSFLQYKELKNLSEKENVAAYLLYYRKELMLDTYQSVYNNLMENKHNLREIFYFIRSLDRKMLKFINEEKSIPLTFKVLKVLVKLLHVGS